MIEEKKLLLPQMPEPPSYLLAQELEQISERLLTENTPITESIQERSQNSGLRSVDMAIYEVAVDERKIAEIRSAEIYSKYLEVVSYSEKLIKKLNAFERFRKRIRPLVERAKQGDNILIENLQLARLDLENARDLINSFNLKNQALEAALSTHQEAFMQLSKQMAQAESAMNYANDQFQLLSEDYEKRGDLISNTEQALSERDSRIFELTDKAKTLQSKIDTLVDENMLLGNQLRQTQIHTSGLETLNQELTDSIPKLQKQIHLLEEKLRFEKEDASSKLAAQMDELTRLREGRHINTLVEKSKKLNHQGANPTSEKLTTTTGPLEVKTAKQWNDFYLRWNSIINELSSHSAPIRNLDDEPKQTLTSELGDLDLE